MFLAPYFTGAMIAPVNMIANRALLHLSVKPSAE